MTARVKATSPKLCRVRPRENGPGRVYKKEFDMHQHNNMAECKHLGVEYCPKCDVTYCEDCGREWGKTKYWPEEREWPKEREWPPTVGDGPSNFPSYARGERW